MDKKKKDKFLQTYKFLMAKIPSYSGRIEEMKNGYKIYVDNFEDFIDILNLLGQMAAQFNVGYGYEEGNENRIETYDYEIAIIDFDSNWESRSTEYI